jgi:hypothetical protein
MEKVQQSTCALRTRIAIFHPTWGYEASDLRLHVITSVSLPLGLIIRATIADFVGHMLGSPLFLFLLFLQQIPLLEHIRCPFPSN